MIITTIEIGLVVAFEQTKRIERKDKKRNDLLGFVFIDSINMNVKAISEMTRDAHKKSGLRSFNDICKNHDSLFNENIDLKSGETKGINEIGNREYHAIFVEKRFLNKKKTELNKKIKGKNLIK